jgi:microsomal dipeptidase-like Zn-dependent dipeptidase
MLRRVLLILVLLIVLAVAAVFAFGPAWVDRSYNTVADHDPWPVSEEARALHDRLLVADLHADTLLWQRDPTQRHDRGHTDLPRLREGGVFLQVFTAVTKSPSGLNYEENTASSDQITKLAIAQRWPRATWGSLFERARFQAGRLAEAAAADDDFVIVRTSDELRAALERRAGNPNVLAGVLGIEGAHPLEGDLDNLDRLYADGYRLVGLQHFFDNELGGSLHGQSGEGLTPFGRAVVEAAEARSMMIDVAHSSPAVVEDVLAMASRPVIVSHTGIASLCPSHRNVPDDLIEKIVARGGLIGIGFWDDAICDATPDGIAETIIYGIGRFGEDAIALGSDFDGTVETYLDASELAAITDALLRRGLSERQIAKVMGGNQIRFFIEYLPGKAL